MISIVEIFNQHQTRQGSYLRESDDIELNMYTTWITKNESEMRTLLEVFLLFIFLVSCCHARPSSRPSPSPSRARPEACSMRCDVCGGIFTSINRSIQKRKLTLLKQTKTSIYFPGKKNGSIIQRLLAPAMQGSNVDAVDRSNFFLKINPC